jgi:hypothetical protein
LLTLAFSTTSNNTKIRRPHNLYNKRACPTKKEPQQGFLYLLYNKRVHPTKNEPQQGISYLERAREGGEREGGVGYWVSRQSCLR